MAEHIEVPQGRLFIDGEWCAAASQETLPVQNPATGETVGSLAAGGPDDVDRAVRAARREVDEGAWSRTSGIERAQLLGAGLTSSRNTARNSPD